MMALTPINFATDTEEVQTVGTVQSVQPSKTWRMDLTSGRIGGFIDGREAVRQYIRKVLMTPRNRYLIYDEFYGEELRELIGQGMTPTLMDVEIPGLVREAIQYDDRIEAIPNVEVTQFGSDGILVAVTVELVDGDLMAITPRFSEETEQAILERMLDAIREDVGKRQGDIAYDLSDPAAQELAQAYVALDQTLSFAFLNEDMPSDLLTLAASDLGVDRKPAVKASGDVTLTGPVSQLVPQGTQVRTDGGVYFTTQADVVLTTGTAQANVIAVVGGTVGNVLAGDIDTIVGDLAGVVSVSNFADFSGGINEESDEALLQRTYDKVRKPATSGNGYHYEQWAKEVSGVGDAKAYPVWNGPGTVKVVLLSDDKRTPAPNIIEHAEQHINSERPIGANVTVVGVTELPININATLTLANGANLEEAKADFELAIIEYLDTLAFADSLVRYTKIAAILLDVPRIIDYADLTVNGGTGNVQTTEDQVAVVGTVLLNA